MVDVYNDVATQLKEFVQPQASVSFWVYRDFRPNQSPCTNPPLRSKSPGFANPRCAFFLFQWRIWSCQCMTVTHGTVIQPSFATVLAVLQEAATKVQAMERGRKARKQAALGAGHRFL